MSGNAKTDGDDGLGVLVDDGRQKDAIELEHGSVISRSPVHVVYGGAHLFRSDTTQKLGRIALESLNAYASNFVEFAEAMHIRGSETLPYDAESIKGLEDALASDPESIKSANFSAWLAWQVYRRTREKLEREPVEDLRIDFEDGYGVRPDEEEDLHAALAASELAASIAAGTSPASAGIRIKPLSGHTSERALRTLDIFVGGLFDAVGPDWPFEFSVTLPKVERSAEVKQLARHLSKLEKRGHAKKGSISIEIMIETPAAVLDGKGRPAMRKLVKAAGGRCSSAHFGAYDYTAALGISARDQGLRHPACDLARQLMLLELSSTGVRLYDSVTTSMPIPVHRHGELTPHEVRENKHAVHSAWQAHFANILYSMSNGYYQSWDLHPGQLVARFAAVNFFYRDGFDEQASRMRSFIENSAQATLTGAAFDDAASARGIAAFFVRGVSCGALTESEVRTATGFSTSDLAHLFDQNKKAVRNERHDITV